ncbi:MAG: hypothetical protein ACRC0F_09885, partial [Cetobacterium sp.]
VEGIKITEFLLQEKVEVELLEKIIEAVFESYEFQYSFRNNHLKQFTTKELLVEVMRRQK